MDSSWSTKMDRQYEQEEDKHQTVIEYFGVAPEVINNRIPLNYSTTVLDNNNLYVKHTFITAHGPCNVF